MSWEDALDKWLTPPEEPDPILTDEFNCGIYAGDTYYSVGGWLLSESSLEDCGHYLDEEGETFTCACCDEEFRAEEYRGLYYIIDGIEICKDCVEATESTASEDF